MSKGPVKEYRFDDYCLRSRNSLWKKGAIIRFPPKELLFLSVLVENAGKIISKEQLMCEVWKGGVVNDESLSRCAYSVRKLLGGEADKKYIETIYGKGFIFSYPVSCRIAEETYHSAVIEPETIDSEGVLLLQESEILPDDRRALQAVIAKALPDSVSLITAEIKDVMTELHSITEAGHCNTILRARPVNNDLFSLRISTWNRINERCIDELIGSPTNQPFCHQLQQQILNLIGGAERKYPSAVTPVQTVQMSVNNFSPNVQLCLQQERGNSAIAEETVNIAVNYLDLLLDNNMEGLRKTFYKVQELIEEALFIAPLDARALAIMGLVKAIDKPDRWASHFLSQAMCLAPGNGTVKFCYAWYMLLKGDTKIALDTLQLVGFSDEEEKRASRLKKYIYLQKSNFVRQRQLLSAGVLWENKAPSGTQQTIERIKSIKLRGGSFKKT